MLVASVDCSTSSTSVGWQEVDASGLLLRHAELVAPALPGHAETLLERLTAVLATARFGLRDPELFVYGRGPGTFTGLRIGLASIKGLCLASGAPLKGVSSLAALAMGSPLPGLVAAVTDARRGELFGGLFEVSHQDGVPRAEALMDELVGPVPAVFEQLSERIGARCAVALGSGVIAHAAAAAASLPKQVCLGSSLHAAPRPTWLGLAGYAAFLATGTDALDSAEPVYLREPDARPPKPPVWARGGDTP